MPVLRNRLRRVQLRHPWRLNLSPSRGLSTCDVFRAKVPGGWLVVYEYQNEDGFYQGHPLFYPDRKSTRLNSSHLGISYAVFCLNNKSTRLNSSHLGMSYAVSCLQKTSAIET